MKMIDKKITVARGPRPVLENDCSLVKKPLKKTTHPTKPTRTGRWTQEEKLLFLYGLSRFGRGKWKKIGTFLPTRSLIQIKSHAQKVMKRFEAGENVFAALEENREYFDCLVLPNAKLAKKGASDLLGVPPLVEDGVKPTSKTLIKGRKQALLGRQSSSPRAPFPKRRKDVTPTRPNPALLARRSVFQATLGNGNLSFSFKNGSRVPTTFHEDSSSSHCSSPDPMGHADTVGGTAIAAAALCQLSTLGRSEKSVVVSP